MQPNTDPSNDFPSAQPITPHQLPEPPAAPARRTPIGLIAALAAMLVIVAAFGALLFVRNGKAPTSTINVPQAQAILDEAAASGLRDTSFNLAIKEAGSFSNTTVNVTGSGKGAIILKPFRMVLNLAIGGYGTSGSTEEIVDGTTIYIKEPLLNGSSNKKPWFKITVPAGTYGTGVSTDDFLDYTKLHNPKYLGEATINGHKTWHLQIQLLGELSPSSMATALAQQNGLSLTATEDFWVQEDTKFPAQITLTITDKIKEANISTPTAVHIVTSTVTETMLFTKWNSNVVINLPPPSQVQTEPYPTLTPVPTPAK